MRYLAPVMGAVALASVTAPASAATTVYPLNISTSGGFTFGTCPASLASGQSCDIAQNGNGPNYRIAFTATDGFISITQVGGSPYTSPNRALFFSAGGDNPFTSASLSSATGITNFGASNLTLSNGTLAVNFNGASLSGAAIRINVSTNPLVAGVPETSTWLMMIAGFGGIGFAMRRRSNVTTRIRFA